MKFKRVLLVDDDDVCNYLNKRVVQKLDVAENIVILKDGKEALDYIRENCRDHDETSCPDFILLDINMPVMNGFEFLEELHQERANFKFNIVLCTSSNNYSDLLETNKYKVSGYINKPLNEEKLKPHFA